MSMNYRKIWEDINGSIPIDKYGRTYEIHHRDGNRENNDPKNLLCVSIEDHFNIHLKQGDWGACVCIARRMLKTPEELAAIQRDRPLNPKTARKISETHKRGHAEGRIKSWNEGKSGAYKLNVNRKNKRYSSKLTDVQVKQIRLDFESWCGTFPCRSEINTFARLEHTKHGVTITTIINILRATSWKENVTWQ